MVLTRSMRKPPETPSPEGQQETETLPEEVVAEPDSGLGVQSESEEDHDNDDYTGFYTVVQNGAKAPDKAVNTVVASAEVAEDSSEGEFGLRDMVGTGVIGDRPVITAMPSLVASDDEI